MEQGAIPLAGLRLGWRDACFPHDVLGELAHAAVDVPLLGVQLQLGALLEQLLQLLLGKGLAISLLVSARLELGQKLDHLRLELAPIVHRLGRLVRVAFPLLPRRVGELIDQGLIIFLGEVSGVPQVLRLPLILWLGLVLDSGDDLVSPQGGLGGILHCGRRGAQPVQDAGQHGGLLLVFPGHG